MKVLSIMVDVSNLTNLEITELKYAMEVQAEEAGGKCKAEKTDDNSHLFDAPVLSSKVKEIKDEEVKAQTH